MKYFSLLQIQESLEKLRPHHPILGITFLVLKKAKAPIGSQIKISLDALNADFLREHYRVNPKSDYFFRVLRCNTMKDKDWVNPNYASTGLQSINTGNLKNTFLHARNQDYWGFNQDYIEELKYALPRDRQRLSLFHLAVWIYKHKEWENNLTRSDIVNKFINDFLISDEEKLGLFDTTIESAINEDRAFIDSPVKWHDILEGYSAPPDVKPEQGGILEYLEVEGVGPVDPLVFNPAKRMNIITGDNGLGKTFLLDLSWYSLTQSWADLPAQPKINMHSNEASIKFSVSSEISNRPVKVKYSPKERLWKEPEKLPSISGLVLYARVDGSFAVWDPINVILSENVSGLESGVVFSRKEVWDGKVGQIEGLLRDWVKWQERKDKYPEYSVFENVLTKLLPSDIGPVVIGDPVRLPNHLIEIPTLVHPYGKVPILFESAGYKRIATLAYLIVWAWQEHKIQAKQGNRKEERQIVILIDEAEAHLHPKWQRKILPAILSIADELHSELSLQLIVSTHSPLVLASSEPVFDSENDKLFHLDVSQDGKINFVELPYELRGTIDSWLSSPVFGIKHPGSDDRSKAIEEAVELQESEDITKEKVETINKKLKEVLPPEDTFWVRWIFFAEKHGVQV